MGHRRRDRLCGDDLGGSGAPDHAGPRRLQLHEILPEFHGCVSARPSTVTSVRTEACRIDSKPGSGSSRRCSGPARLERNRPLVDTHHGSRGPRAGETGRRGTCPRPPRPHEERRPPRAFPPASESHRGTSRRPRRRGRSGGHPLRSSSSTSTRWSSGSMPCR